MKDVGYYNGVYAPIDEIQIPMKDRGYYFGDGVYDVTYAHNHVPFALDEHLDRFYSSMELLDIHCTMPREEIAAIIQKAIDMVDSDEQLVYWQMTRGTYDRMHAYPPADVKPNLMLYTNHHPLSDISKRYQFITAEDTRWLHCNIKSINLIPSVMASQKAKSAGCIETILHRNGMVTEGASSNIFIIRNGVLQTAPLSNLLLPGITRKHLIGLAGELGIPVVEEHFTLEELMNADEVLCTSASRHGLAADRIDGKPVGGKAPELVDALQQAYRKKLLRDTAK